jgi:hypothetical protein
LSEARKRKALPHADTAGGEVQIASQEVTSYTARLEREAHTLTLPESEFRG